MSRKSVPDVPKVVPSPPQGWSVPDVPKVEGEAAARHPTFGAELSGHRERGLGLSRVVALRGDGAGS